MVLYDKFGKTEEDLKLFLKEYNLNPNNSSGIVIFSTSNMNIIEGLTLLFDENDFVEYRLFEVTSDLNNFYTFCDVEFSYDFSNDIRQSLIKGEKVVYLRTYHIEMDTYIKIMKYIFDKPITIYYYAKETF